jgi:hypothetical protein
MLMPASWSAFSPVDFESMRGTQQGSTAARNDAFLDGCTGRVQRVVDAVLLLFHFHFGRTADADDGNAACQLGKTLLQLLTVVVGGGFLDLRLDLTNAAFDLVLRAGAVDDGGVLLRDRDFLGGAEHVERDVFELDAEIFGDDLAAGQDRDVLEHGLAAVAEARRLDGSDLQAAAQLVDDERRQRLAFDVFSDDEQRTRGLNHRFQDRKHGLQVRELLLVQQNVRVFEIGNVIFSGLVTK